MMDTETKEDKENQKHSMQRAISWIPCSEIMPHNYQSLEAF